MEVYPTQYGDVVRPIVPSTVHETVQAPGYHRLGNLYMEDHRVKGERTLMERALACKGIPSLRVCLARHGAVPAPLVRVPGPQWQMSPKD